MSFQDLLDAHPEYNDIVLSDEYLDRLRADQNFGDLLAIMIDQLDSSVTLLALHEAINNPDALEEARVALEAAIYDGTHEAPAAGTLGAFANNNQYGFVRGDWSVDATITLLNDITLGSVDALSRQVVSEDVMSGVYNSTAESEIARAVRALPLEQKLSFITNPNHLPAGLILPEPRLNLSIAILDNDQAAEIYGSIYEDLGAQLAAAKAAGQPLLIALGESHEDIGQGNMIQMMILAAAAEHGITAAITEANSEQQQQVADMAADITYSGRIVEDSTLLDNISDRYAIIESGFTLYPGLVGDYPAVSPSTDLDDNIYETREQDMLDSALSALQPEENGTTQHAIYIMGSAHLEAFMVPSSLTELGIDNTSLLDTAHIWGINTSASTFFGNLGTPEYQDGAFLTGQANAYYDATGLSDEDGIIFPDNITLDAFLPTGLSANPQAMLDFVREAQATYHNSGVQSGRNEAVESMQVITSLQYSATEMDGDPATPPTILDPSARVL